MKTYGKKGVLLFVGLLGVGLVMPLRAASPTGTAIFDNSQKDLLTRFDPGTLEVGDEILLASTERYLTYFDFEFWGVNTIHSGSFSGDVEARVRFYQNNGAPFNGYARPSDMFFDSGWFSVGRPTDRSTFVFTQGSDFPAGGLYVPTSDMTWSVQFQGLGEGDSLGVDLYSPPAVGQDYPDYWENNGGWTLLTNTLPMDFAARMYANANVPEPSSLVLSLVGGLGILSLARRLRRDE